MNLIVIVGLAQTQQLGLCCVMRRSGATLVHIKQFPLAAHALERTCSHGSYIKYVMTNGSHLIQCRQKKGELGTEIWIPSRMRVRVY